MLPLPTDASYLWFLAVVLASWRITAFLAYEAGPFDLGTRLRRGFAGLGLIRLVTCFHCIGVWVSLALTITVFEWRWRTLVLAIAVAGAISALERGLGGGAAAPSLEDS